MLNQEGLISKNVKEKIRVLVVVPCLLPPATKMAGLRIIYELYKRVNWNPNVEICILTSKTNLTDRDYQKWIDQQREEENLKVYVVSDRLYKSGILGMLKFKFDFWMKARGLDKKYDFDIIHDYSSAPLLFGFDFFYKKVMKKTVFHTLCTSNKTWLASFKFNFGIRFIDRVICANRHITHELKKCVPKKYKSRISYMSLGVDSEKFLAQQDTNFLRDKFKILSNKKVILFTGPLEDRKGALVLAEAAVDLLKIRDDVEFVFVVYGKNGLDQMHVANKHKFLRLIKGFEKSIHILEGECDIPLLMVSSDIFVLPSITSHGIIAHPLTLLEAMSAGKAIVASRIDGVEEVIDDGVNGFLFKNKNVGDLVCNLNKLLDDDDLRLQLGQNAKNDIIENYSIDIVAKRVIHLYESCIY